MTESPLSVLEELRRDSVEVAQRALAEACAELAQSEALYTEAGSARSRCQQALQSERTQFGEARSVALLRLGEERLRALTQELSVASARVGRVAELCQRARERVEAGALVLAEAERARRAVGSVLELQRSALHKQRERAEEDQAEDAFRSRPR